MTVVVYARGSSVPSGASKLGFATAPFGAADGVPLGQQPAIEVQNAAGARVTGSTASITVAVATGTCTLSGTTTISAVAGVATFTDLVLTGTGAVTLSFASIGLTGVTSASFTSVVVMFYDDYSTVPALTRTQNGCSYAPSTNNVSVISSFSRPGCLSGKCAKFHFNPLNAELRYDGVNNGAGLTELFRQWYIYLPDGTESPSVGVKVEISNNGGENKFARDWGDSDAEYSVNPGCKVGLDLMGVNISPDGKLFMTYEFSNAAKNFGTTIPTNITINHTNNKKISNTTPPPSLSVYSFAAGSQIGGGTTVDITGGTGFTPQRTWIAADDGAGALTLGTAAGTVDSTNGEITVYYQYSNGWDGVSPKLSFVNAANRGRWVQMRTRVKVATAANNDGVYQCWVDGVLFLSLTNMQNWPYGVGPTAYTSGYLFGEWDSTPAANTNVYVSELLITQGGFPS